MKLAMKVAILFCTLYVSHCPVNSQDNIQVDTVLTGSYYNDFMKLPRIRKDYAAPGSYQIVGNLTKSKIAAGDTTFLNVYFTGYGAIGNSKIFFSTSPRIFRSESTMHSSIKLDTVAPGKVTFNFGAHVDSLNSQAVIINSFLGVSKPGWEYYTQYVDMVDTDSLVTTIATEIAAKPPLHFKLYSLNDVKPGDYNIILCFTYFNSKEWKTSMQNIPIHVNNYFEDNPKFLPTLSFIAVIIGLATVSLNARTFWINFVKRPRDQKAKESVEVNLQKMQSNKITEHEIASSIPSIEVEKGQDQNLPTGGPKAQIEASISMDKDDK